MKKRENFTEEILHYVNKFILNEGKGSKEELEAFYKLEIRLKLIATGPIITKLITIKTAIATHASKLIPLPDEFIPKFEDDDHRRERLEARKKTEAKREKEWEKAQPELYKLFDELSELMKIDLKDKKGT